MLPELGERRLDHHPVERVDHLLPRLVLAAPPGRNRRHVKVFTEDVTAEPWQERHQRRGLDDAAAKTVGDEHVAGARGLNQARHAKQRVTAQFERIAEVVVEAAQNDVHRIQARKSLEVDALVANREIGSSDQREIPLPSEERVLEVGFAVRP